MNNGSSYFETIYEDRFQQYHQRAHSATLFSASNIIIPRLWQASMANSTGVPAHHSGRLAVRRHTTRLLAHLTRPTSVRLARPILSNAIPSATLSVYH